MSYVRLNWSILMNSALRPGARYSNPRTDATSTYLRPGSAQYIKRCTSAVWYAPRIARPGLRNSSTAYLPAVPVCSLQPGLTVAAPSRSHRCGQQIWRTASCNLCGTPRQVTAGRTTDRELVPVAAGARCEVVPENRLRRFMCV